MGSTPRRLCRDRATEGGQILLPKSVGAPTLGPKNMLPKGDGGHP